MKKQYMILMLNIIILILIFSCIKIDNYEKEYNTLISNYNSNQNIKNAVKLGEFYFNKYSNSIKKIEEGLMFFKESLMIFPESPELAVLQGNLYTKYGGCFSKKFDYAKAVEYCGLGFEIMDETVLKYPDNKYVLIYRAGNSLTVPSMLNRFEYALIDLEKLYHMEDLSGKIEMLTLYYYHKALLKDKQKDAAKKIKKELQKKYPNYKKEI